jgi:hypothetical protein
LSGPPEQQTKDQPQANRYSYASFETDRTPDDSSNNYENDDRRRPQKLWFLEIHIW